MGPLAMMGMMALAGAVKSKMVDEPKERRDRELAAETQRYSPWTGLKANPIREANMFDSAMKYGATGASMGQANQQAEYDKALLDNLKGGGGSVRHTSVAKAPTSNPWSSPYLGGTYDF